MELEASSTNQFRQDPGRPLPHREAKRVYVETLGCAKNRVDSEIMLGALQSRGYTFTLDPAQAEVIIVNTCAFLTSASEESIERILALSDFKSSGQCEKLVCAGCLSERYRDSLMEEIPELDGIFGSSRFHEIPALLDDLYSGRENAAVALLPKPHYAHYESLQRVRTTSLPSVYVKIAEGCSNMCSFCNIPFLRGYFSSRPIDSVVAEIRNFAAEGVKEINLISQDTSSYGVDLRDGTSLADLLGAIDSIDGDFWVRLFYAYPNTFGNAELERMQDSRHLVPYLDMPFQHISDRVLRDMNRRISGQEIRAKLEWLREAVPQLALRTTFIVGFPTEEEGDFEQLLTFVGEGWFDHVGVFVYSHEDNIKSARFGDPLPNSEKRVRRRLLMEAQQRVSAERNASRVGETYTVLVEGRSAQSDLLLQGRTAFQGPEVDGVVLINEGQAQAGAFHRVEITEAHPYDLVGKIVP